jgi:hypothetical protein
VTDQNTTSFSAAALRGATHYYTRCNDWNSRATEHQAHNGPVDEQTTPVVQYHYNDGASAERAGDTTDYDKAGRRK